MKHSSSRRFFLLFWGLIILCTGVVTPLPLNASDKAKPPLPNLARLYKVHWNGLHIADFSAEMKQDTIRTTVKTYGLVKKISKFSSFTETRFLPWQEGIIPKQFHMAFRQRQGDKTVDISYNAKGSIAQESVIPPDNRAKRPAVLDEQKKGAVDPLAAILVAREHISSGLKSGPKDFEFKLYDGRRLSLLKFHIHGRKEIDLSGETHQVILVTFKRLPVAGYTKNELTRAKQEEPLFSLYLSDDILLLPLKIVASAPLGEAVLLLERKCTSLEECS